jgi:hypothetical protein
MTTAPPELASVTELRQAFHINHPNCEQVLKAAGLEPLFVRGKMKLYDKGAASAALEAHRIATTPPPAAESQAAADIDDVAAAVREVLKPSFARLLEGGADTDIRIERVCELVDKLHQQNALLLRTLGDMKLDMINRLDVLQAAVEQLRVRTGDEPLLDQPPPLPATVKALEPQARKPRIGIASLLDQQAAMIEREFSQVLDLRIIKSGDGRGARQIGEALASCDVVVGLVNFMGHSMEAAIKAKGAKVVKVGGGMTALREKLTELYVQSADRKAA